MVVSMNVAIMFFKSDVLLTLIPLSTIQNTIQQLRVFIDKMKFLSPAVHYFFVLNNGLVSVEDVGVGVIVLMK